MGKFVQFEIKINNFLKKFLFLLNFFNLNLNLLHNKFINHKFDIKN